jgi:VanZ family protein
VRRPTIRWNSPGFSRFRAWLLVVIWASAIFTFSTDAFSSDHTQNVVVGILHTLFPFLAQTTLFSLHDFLRKCAHVGEYFVFGVLLFRAFRTPARGWQWHWAFLAILAAALYASSDEIHQIFVPSRGASIWDALLDTGGASVAQLAAWVLNRREQPSNDREFDPRLS